MAFRFEGLEIFHEAIDFSARVYSMVKKFPSEERFDLTSQARKAANSAVLNIAEGSGRGTKRDFSRFLDLAPRSKRLRVFLLPKNKRTFRTATWSRSRDMRSC